MPCGEWDVEWYCGGKVDSLGTIDIQFQVAKTTLMHTFLVIPGVSSEFLLGVDFFKQFQCVMNYKFEKFSFDDEGNLLT